MPRHAAALALVGWYLMVPPWNGSLSACHKSFPDCEAISDFPLRQWEISQSFDSADSCENAKAEIQHKAAKDFNEAAFNVRENLTERRADRLLVDERNLKALCIATDDPRLK